MPSIDIVTTLDFCWCPIVVSMAQSLAKHIVITGASSGLGAALARAYAKPGVEMTLSGRHEERLTQVAAECGTAGADVSVVLCDVTDVSSMAAWLKSADRKRPIDIVIANAGVGGRAALAPAEGETVAAAHVIFATNTLGVVNTVTPVLPSFVARRRGHFVIISSLAGLLGLPHSPAYCGSKAAVRTYAEGLRRLVRPCGVGVTIVNPGFVDTPMSRSLPKPGPQTWTAERAAAAIVDAIHRGAPEFSFPWSLRAAILATRFLPARLVDAVLARSYQHSQFGP
jgi:short-subunit dehydrogenase